jgi:hypothetical protein
MEFYWFCLFFLYPVAQACSRNKGFDIQEERFVLNRTGLVQAKLIDATGCSGDHNI